MGQPEIVQLLRRDKWLSLRDISQELKVRHSSVNKSVQIMLRMPNAFGIEFERRKRNAIFLRKR